MLIYNLVDTTTYMSILLPKKNKIKNKNTTHPFPMTKIKCINGNTEKITPLVAIKPYKRKQKLNV